MRPLCPGCSIYIYVYLISRGAHFIDYKLEGLPPTVLTDSRYLPVFEAFLISFRVVLVSGMRKWYL